MTAFIQNKSPNNFTKTEVENSEPKLGNKTAVEITTVQEENPLLPTKPLPINSYEFTATQLKVQLGLDDSLLATDAIRKIPFLPMKASELEELFQLLIKPRQITGKDDLLAVNTTYADILIQALEDAKADGLAVEEIYLVGSEAPCVLHDYIVNNLTRWGAPNASVLTCDLRTRKLHPRLDVDVSFDMPGIATQTQLSDRTKKIAEFLERESLKPESEKKVHFNEIWNDGFKEKCMPWKDDSPVKLAMVAMEQQDPKTEVKGSYFEVKFVKSNNGASFFECDSFRIPLKSLLEAWKQWTFPTNEFLAKNAKNLNIIPSAKHPDLSLTKESGKKDSIGLHQAIIDELSGVMREKYPKAHDLVGWVRQLTKSALGLRRIDPVLGEQSAQCNDGLYAEVCRRAKVVFPKNMSQGKIYLTLMACQDLLTYKKDTSAQFIDALLKQLTSDIEIEHETVIKETSKNGKDHLLAIWEELKDPKKLQSILALLALSGFQALTASSPDSRLTCTLYTACQNAPMLDILIEDFHLPLPLDLETACKTLLNCEALPSIALLERLYGNSPLDLSYKSNNELTDTLIEYAQQFADSASPFLQHLTMPLFLQSWSLDPSRNLDTTFLNLFNKTLRTDQRYLTDLALAKKLVKGVEAHKTIDDWLTFVPQIPQKVNGKFSSDLRNGGIQRIFLDILLNPETINASEVTKLYAIANGFARSKELDERIAQLVQQMKSQTIGKELQEQIVDKVSNGLFEEAATALTNFPDKQSPEYKAAQLHYTTALCKQEKIPFAKCLNLVERLLKKKWDPEQTQALDTCKDQIATYILQNPALALKQRKQIKTVFSNQENLIQALDNEVQRQKQEAFNAEIQILENKLAETTPEEAFKILERLALKRPAFVEKPFQAQFLDWINTTRVQINALIEKQKQEAFDAKLQQWTNQLPSSTPKEALESLEALADSQGASIEEPPFQAKFFDWLMHPQRELNLLAKTVDAHLPFLLREKRQWLAELFQNAPIPTSIATHVFLLTAGELPSSRTWAEKIASDSTNRRHQTLTTLMIAKGHQKAAKNQLQTFDKTSPEFFKLTVAFTLRFANTLKSLIEIFEKLNQLPTAKETEGQIHLEQLRQMILEQTRKKSNHLEALAHKKQILAHFKVEELPKDLQTSFLRNELIAWKIQLPAQTTLADLENLKQIAAKYGLEIESSLRSSFIDWFDNLAPEHLNATINSYDAILIAERSEKLKAHLLNQEPAAIVEAELISPLIKLLRARPEHTCEIHTRLLTRFPTYPDELQLQVARQLSQEGKDALAEPLWLDLLRKKELEEIVLNPEDSHLVWERALAQPSLPLLYKLVKDVKELTGDYNSPFKRAYRVIEAQMDEKTCNHAELLKFMETTKLRCPITFTNLFLKQINNAPDDLAEGLLSLYWSQVEGNDLAISQEQRKSMWEALWRKKPDPGAWIFKLAIQSTEKLQVFLNNRDFIRFLSKILDKYCSENPSHIAMLLNKIKGSIPSTLAAKLRFLSHKEVGQTNVEVAIYYGYFKKAIQTFTEAEQTTLPSLFEPYWIKLMQAASKLEKSDITDAWLEVLLKDLENGNCLNLSPLPAYMACIKSGRPHLVLKACKAMTSYLLASKELRKMEANEFLIEFFNYLAHKVDPDSFAFKTALLFNPTISQFPSPVTCLLRISGLDYFTDEAYSTRDPEMLKRCIDWILPVIETDLAATKYAETLGYSIARLYCLTGDKVTFDEDCDSFYTALDKRFKKDSQLHKELGVAFHRDMAEQFIHFVANDDRLDHKILLAEALKCVQGIYRSLVEGYPSEKDGKLVSDTFNILQIKVADLSQKKHEEFLVEYKKIIADTRAKDIKNEFVIVEIPPRTSSCTIL